MNTSILPRGSVPLKNNELIRNTNNVQYQNKYSNLTYKNGANSSNNQLKLTNTYNITSNNNGRYTIGKIQKLKTISSGTLLPSSRAKKFNRVIKNGAKIKNVDINNDYEDIRSEEDTESLSTNANLKKRNNLTNKNISKNEYLGNSTQNKIASTLEPQTINKVEGTQLMTATSEVAKPPIKMNIFATFINKILDKINPNINKREKQFDPYNNEEIMRPKTYFGELSSEISDRTIKNKNLNIQQNNLIKNTNNNNNLINKTTKTIIKNNNNKILNSKENELPKQIPKNSDPIKQPKNTIQKEPTLTSLESNLSSKFPISNAQIDKVSNNNESNLNYDKKSQSTTKKEDELKSKKSESKSSINKFPFQPLKDIMHSPKSKLSSNITFPNSNTYITQPSDTYLISHIGEHVQKEVQPIQLISDDIYNQKKNKGFRFCSELTQAGKEANGLIKTDQDTSLISLSVGGIIGFNIFGVLDGHGPHGHHASQFFRDYFVKNMINYTEALKLRGLKTSEGIYNELKYNKFSYIIDLFNNADLELTKQNPFDYTLSGTTCNLIFQFNKHLICFSVGDSRCILVYDKGDYTNQGIFPLSTDHKPNLPGEIERIKLSGGEVDTMRDMYGSPIGPPRVYKRGSEYPGLAMSRSLGDFQAKEVGVISVPQIIEYDINASTKFLVVCSDGVWEFASNEQVRDIGNIFYARNDAASFCIELVKFAMILWEQLDVIRDDITVVAVFF